MLENLEVYRNRLSNSDQKLGIIADLYRPHPMSTTAALLAVMSVLPILNSHAALGFPPAFRLRVPVSPTDVLVKQ